MNIWIIDELVNAANSYFFTEVELKKDQIKVLIVRVKLLLT